MLSLLWLVPALPIAAYVVLGLAGRRMGRNAIGYLGATPTVVSALIALGIAISFLVRPPAANVFVQHFWTWLPLGDPPPGFALYLDPLSVIMVLVVTWVAALILIYAVQYMRDEDGYSRFFAYINLFVGSMLILVLADNLLMLYLGWEGVGLCSYLLIGFWYTDPENGRAARKAFIVTRVGDAALIVGLFLLYAQLGTLNIQAVASRATAEWTAGAGVAAAAAALIFVGAMGKSAQAPFHVWLPDAMAGPVPVSALIHAATMVTAGVYLIARMHTIFDLAPAVHTAVAVIGAITLVLAGCSALVQRDIKRVLAFSTISQIGYMFLALGVGAWAAAIFHFMTHAFFKSLLFLGSGAIIRAFGGEHDLHKMGGLRKRMPLTFWTFLAGAGSLASLPLITAGFYSKDLILWRAWNAPSGGFWLWAAGTVGVILTSLYVFRLFYLVFYGPLPREVAARPGRAMSFSMLILATLSVCAGWLQVPRYVGKAHLIVDFLAPVFNTGTAREATVEFELMMQVIESGIALAGIYIAYLWFRERSRQAIAETPIPNVPAPLAAFWKENWGFDRLNDVLLVRPYAFLARLNANDVVDRFFAGVAEAARLANESVIPFQTGKIRLYAAGIVLGAIVLVSVVVFA